MKQTFTKGAWGRLLQAFSVLLLLPLLGRAQSPGIVISQVYGGGGSPTTAATYRQDYVELFNRSTTDQTIGGFTIQYGAATGTSSFGVSSAIPAGTILPAGSYYLVALGTGTVGTPTGAVLPVAADFTPANTLNLAATAGRVALVSNSTPLTGTSPANAPTVIDYVGYGAAATYEGSAPVAPLSTTTAAVRGNSCTDTNQNAADFTVAAPAPRNASQPRNICGNTVLVVNPSALVFSAPTGQVATTATYTLAGYNLTGNATYTISSNSPAVLLSTTGAAGSFAQTASVTATGGSLSQVITVQFTAPAPAGTTAATITNSNGALGATVAVTGASIAAYTWNGSASSYSSMSGWTPTRTNPSNLDVLLFNGAVTPTANVLLDYAASQTVGQLQFINNVSATLSINDTRTLVLDGNLPGDDLLIGAGSVVTVANTAAAPITTGGAGLAISLASGETAVMSGTLVFAGYTGTTNGRHTIQATTTGAIQFLAGSVFQAASTYNSTNPFGSATASASSVIFRNGARFEQFGGLSPFGNSTAVVTIFEPASYFLSNSSSAPSLTGRTYGSLEINGNTSPSGSNLLTIQGDLIINSGTVNINLTGGVLLQGNLQVNNAAQLSFSPAAASTVQLSGITPQALSGTSTTPITFGPNATLQVNNAAGITLGFPATVSGTLQLTSGLLTTTTARPLTLAATATVTAGSNASFVNGPVVRPLSAPGTYVFPVGKGTAFRPFTLTVTASNNTTYYYRAEQFEGNPGQSLATGSGLTRVSRIRSFTVVPFASASDAASTMAAATQPVGFSGTATLSFGSDDGVTDPTQLVVAKRATTSVPWANFGSTASTGTATSNGAAVSGTVTSGPVTSFSDFALGSTSSDILPNPLPVTLISFGATRQASGAVQVAWATASEKHSAYFEVQRSLDGNAFTTIAKVAAQGTTAQAHTYASLDQAAPAAKLYYRLHQVDIDGKASFSPVVTLAATEAAATLALYPNPAHGSLTVAAAAGEQAQVIDLAGRVLQTTTLPASGQFSVESLPAGTYLLRMQLGSQPRTLRFTKE
jgi:hypothetical protein